MGPRFLTDKKKKVSYKCRKWEAKTKLVLSDCNCQYQYGCTAFKRSINRCVCVGRWVCTHRNTCNLFPSSFH